MRSSALEAILKALRMAKLLKVIKTPVWPCLQSAALFTYIFSFVFACAVAAIRRRHAERSIILDLRRPVSAVSAL